MNEESTEKLKLCFVNKIPSTIYTNNDIEADNGEPLQIVLCDINHCNDIVLANPLSSALIKIVVLDGQFGQGDQDEFDKKIVTERGQRRPLLVGTDKTIRLKNGVAVINNLYFTQNSSRSSTKKVRLGVRIIDDEILKKYPRIIEAVSNPFRVKDHRGQGTFPQPF